MWWMILDHLLGPITEAEAKQWQPSAEQFAAFAAVDRVSGERISSVSGGVHTIRVKGTLTKAPSFFAHFFGGGNTTYSEIIAAVNSADADGAKEIVLAIDSGGGQTSGLFEAMAAIANAKAPTRAVIDGMAASAAYGLASQADKIEATSPADVVGSVGVVMGGYIDADFVEVTSTNAPNKRPDLSTEEGKATVREFLDQIESQFIDAIAAGRKVSTDTVKSDFGRGGVMVAKKAIDQGMIDGIVATYQAAGSSGNAQNKPTKGGTKMDLDELKAQHPKLYADVMGIGAAAERERCQAHLELGKAGGAAGMAIAVEAIEKGSPLGALLQAKYIGAMGNAKATEDRNADDGEVGGSTSSAAPSKTATEDAVHATIIAELGGEA